MHNFCIVYLTQFGHNDPVMAVRRRISDVATALAAIPQNIVYAVIACLDEDGERKAWEEAHHYAEKLGIGIHGELVGERPWSTEELVARLLRGDIVERTIPVDGGIERLVKIGGKRVMHTLYQRQPLITPTRRILTIQQIENDPDNWTKTGWRVPSWQFDEHTFS